MIHQKESTIFQKSARQVIAGGSSGLVEICIMHPLDIVKTRLQIQRGGAAISTYVSLTDCIMKIIKHEGPLSLYKGILPPILAETPRRATKFWSFEFYRDICSSVHFTGPWSLVVAGIASGATEGFVLTPFERVKVYMMQAQRTQLSLTSSTWEVTRGIIRRDGLGTRGLYRGMTALLVRDTLFNAVYFGGYYNMKIYLVPHDKQESIPLRLMLGFLAGFLAGLINIPFDVAKSRIQASENSDKYLRTLSTLRTVQREEGFLALTKGLVPRLLRLGPGGAIMLVVYEQVLHYLESL